MTAIACDTETSDTDKDSNPAADSDTDTDTDADADTDSDTDTETEVEGTPIPLTWIHIPMGRFEMGCSHNDRDCNDGEYPVHGVDVSAFEMTQTEITQSQYMDGMGENPSSNPACANCPVDTVAFDDATAFCASLGGRLPSEAEWEYAARGGASTRYVCGDESSCLDRIGWYIDNSNNKTHVVKQKTANDFGLYDMLGNVWEWVEDCWHNDYHGEPPVDGSAWNEGDCTYRIVRGGSFGLDARGMRVSNRDGDYPDVYFIPSPGFRCVRNLTD